MSKLQIRILSGVIGAAVVLGFTFAPPIVFHIAVAIACLLALHELHVTFGVETKWQIVVLDYVFALIFLATPLIYPSTLQGPVPFLLVAYLMLLLIGSVLFHDTVKFPNVTQGFFMLIYGVFLPLHLTYIRMLDHGLALVFLVFLGAWMPDTFAFFAGTLFGRHKLIPSVSPKKTVEGAIGAVVGAVVTFLVYGLLISYFFNYSVNYLMLMFLALLCGVLAQFGDLSASVIKRECNKKDFGNLIPGHGGILDRIDSLIFIAPLVYYFLLVFEVVYK